MDLYHSYAEVFDSLNGSPAWWNFSTVRVEFVWEDVEEKKLYIILLDQNVSKNFHILYIKFRVIIFYM